MLVMGITNKLPKGLRLFMFELDNVEEFIAYEECRFLSEVWDIDIYLLESSPNHYHLISFDILTLDQVSEIQYGISEDSDYLNIKELPLFDDKGLWNTLRIGEKGLTPKPHYLTVFYSRDKEIRAKSLQHFLFYRHFCGIPEETEPRRSYFFNFGYLQLAVYNTGIGAKKKRTDLFWIGNLKISNPNNPKYRRL